MHLRASATNTFETRKNVDLVLSPSSRDFLQRIVEDLIFGVTVGPLVMRQPLVAHRLRCSAVIGGSGTTMYAFEAGPTPSQENDGGDDDDDDDSGSDSYVFAEEMDENDEVDNDFEDTSASDDDCY